VNRRLGCGENAIGRSGPGGRARAAFGRKQRGAREGTHSRIRRSSPRSNARTRARKSGRPRPGRGKPVPVWAGRAISRSGTSQEGKQFGRRGCLAAVGSAALGRIGTQGMGGTREVAAAAAFPILRDAWGSGRGELGPLRDARAHFPQAKGRRGWEADAQRGRKRRTTFSRLSHAARS